MPWPRDVVAERRNGIESARDLLTAMTHAMVAGTGETEIEISVSAISLDAIAATAIVTIDGNVDAVIATAIGTDAGAAGTKWGFLSTDYTD